MELKQKLRDIPMRMHSALNRWRLNKQKDLLEKLQTTDNWCLIVLDACRSDALDQLFNSYFQGSISPVWASGSHTFDYLRTNWRGEHRLPYVTAAAPVTPDHIDFDNPSASADGLHFTGESLREMYQGYQPVEHLKNIDAVWQDSWSEELGVCPPEPVTKRAIEISDASSTLVTHYFQPHAPFIGERRELPDHSDVKGLEGGAVAGDIWDRAREGKVTDRELKLLYQSNLERALIAASELIRETDFRRYVVIGDHGEALGEYGRYAHGLDWHPYVRTVPWAEVEEVDPDVARMEGAKAEFSGNSGYSSVQERLSELGYLA